VSGAISFLEMRTEAVVGSIRVLNELLEVTLSALGAADALRHDLALGLAELVANVCEHELEDGGDGAVGVTLDARSGDLLLTVSSAGPRFDLEAALARAADRDPLENLDGSGLGLPLLVGLFDTVSNDYAAEQGNRITLRKAGWRAA
jgi:anti-sigma regulatory factor (Ser/Thr protein kinase)